MQSENFWRTRSSLRFIVCFNLQSKCHLLLDDVIRGIVLKMFIVPGGFESWKTTFLINGKACNDAVE